MSSFKDYIRRSLDHHREQIESEAIDRAADHVASMSGPGHRRNDDPEIDFEEFQHSKISKSTYECTVTGTFDIEAIDPVDDDDVHIGTGTVRVKIIFRIPSSQEYLQIDSMSTEVTDDVSS